MVKVHVCDELVSLIELDESDTVITISSVDSGDNWELDLYDGDGVHTSIKFCPFCGKRL